MNDVIIASALGFTFPLFGRILKSSHREPGGRKVYQVSLKLLPRAGSAVSEKVGVHLTKNNPIHERDRVTILSIAGCETCACNCITKEAEE